MDSDADGMVDDYEMQFGLGPNDPTDALQDFDGDGMTNLAESLLGTDPNNAHDLGIRFEPSQFKASSLNEIIILSDENNNDINDWSEVPIVKYRKSEAQSSDKLSTRFSLLGSSFINWGVGLEEVDPNLLYRVRSFGPNTRSVLPIRTTGNNGESLDVARLRTNVRGLRHAMAWALA